MNIRELFLRHVAKTNNKPLTFQPERAEGIHVVGADGTRYIDLIAGVSVCNVGHCHPEVVRAIERQARTYMHVMVYGEFVESPQVRFATALADALGDRLDMVYFTNSGAEATEGALKMAKRATGRREIVSFRHSYHGSTMGALSVMGDEVFRRNYRPLVPGNRMVTYGSQEALDMITERTAAVIAEPVQAESGVTVPDPDWLRALRARCDETGALLILDEIQTGFGRTGDLFAHQGAGIVPDVLLLAKAMGGGMPLGAFVAHHELMATLTENPVLGHITTFGGHPVSCAAGLAAFDIVQRDALHQRAEEMGALFAERLQHPAIRRIGRKGLMMALHFDSFEVNEAVIRACFERGVLTDWFLFAPHALRIAPPLVITDRQVHAVCDTILESIEEVAG